MFGIIVAMLINLQSIPVVYVDTPPVIDGKIDSVWSLADSISGFKQMKPDYGRPSNFRTVLKVIQDRENLYFLAVCYTGKFRPQTEFRNPDYIVIYIDPFRAKQEAYLFEVHASGARYDASVSNNGLNRDYSWDAYWFSKVRTYDHFYVVEIKIPFRSIRFKKDLTEWGLQVERYVPQNDEISYWSLYPRDKVNEPSYYGKLLNVKPGVSGHGMEFYPVGILRRDIYSSGSFSNSHIGLDFSWNILPQLMLNITLKPDFAQIEADPFALNFSKFERYFSERRPFFIEAREIFNPITVNIGDIFQPFVVFYSRRIGKKLPDGSEVPIDFGSKLTFKSTNTQFGWISVYTGSKKYRIGEESFVEPAVLWNILRLRFFSEASFSTGFLLSSKTFNGKTDFNLDTDGFISRGHHRILYQGVLSHRDSITGHGLKSAYLFMNLPWLIMTGISYSDKDLDLSSTGYLGQEPGMNIMMLTAYIDYPETGSLLSKTKGIYLKVFKDSTKKTREYMAGLYLSLEARSGHRLEFFGFTGKSLEFSQENTTYGVHFSFNRSSGEGAHYGIYGDLSKSWNYRRHIFSLVSDGGAWLNLSLTSRISGELNLAEWMEFDTTNSIMDIYLTVRPSVNFSISPDMKLVLSSEFVPFYTDKWDLNEIRAGLRYEFDFKPKSKFYIVANKHFVNSEGKLRENESIYAVKLRFALPF